MRRHTRWRTNSSTPRTGTARTAGGRRVGLQAVRAGIERDELDIANGEDNLMIFGDETGNDTRRKVCGSFLYSVVRDGSTSPWDPRRRSDHPPDRAHLVGS
jgi:hypothetical protein